MALVRLSIKAIVIRDGRLLAVQNRDAEGDAEALEAPVYLGDVN